MTESNLCTRRGHTSVQVPQYSATALRLLRTNEPPDLVEKAVLCEELQRGCDMPARSDEEIAMLVDLKAKKKSVQRFVGDHQTILSPLRHTRLPAEILAEIFHFAAPVVDTNVGKGIWSLGRVCSYWRNVLLSAPSLWSTIDITITPNMSQPSLLLVIEAILLRSGSTLLDLVLTIGPSVPAALPEIEMILAESQRWYKVDFTSRHDPNYSVLKGRIPVLHELTYHDQFPEWVAAAPSLQYMNIYLRDTLSSLAVLPAPWSQLRRCRLTGLTCQQEMELLRLCPNLEEYHLLGGLVDPYDDLPSEQILLPNLHTLQFSTCLNHTVSNRLVLPSLTCIIFSYCHSTDISPFADLVSRSSSLLTKLDFIHSDLSYRFLTVVPLQGLTILHLTRYMFLEIIPIIRDVLTISEDSTIYLPRLEQLHLTVSQSESHGLEPDGFAVVIAMTRSRWYLSDVCNNMISRLAFLEFKVNERQKRRPELRGVLAPLVTLSDEGLDIRVDRFYLEKEGESISCTSSSVTAVEL